MSTPPARRPCSPKSKSSNESIVGISIDGLASAASKSPKSSSSAAPDFPSVELAGATVKEDAKAVGEAAEADAMVGVKSSDPKASAGRAEEAPSNGAQSLSCTREASQTGLRSMLHQKKRTSSLSEVPKRKAEGPAASKRSSKPKERGAWPSAVSSSKSTSPGSKRLPPSQLSSSSSSSELPTVRSLVKD